MELNRRDFVLLVAATCAGCQAKNGADDRASPTVTRVIDAGPASLYEADGVYAQLRHQGVFLVKHAGVLVALSSDCTHRDCPLRAMPDQTFSCKCHGSQFDPAGHVTRGPATRDLPRFPTTLDSNHHLLVQVTRLHFDEE